MPDLINSARHLTQEAEDRARGIGVKYTIYCPCCDTDLWMVPLLALRRQKILIGDLEQINGASWKKSRVPRDCLVCGSEVFFPRRGGYFFFTREKGEVPKRGSKLNVRIPLACYFDRNGILSGVQRMALGLGEDQGTEPGEQGAA